MWCVADLTEDYITKMEDVLEAYEQPYNGFCAVEPKAGCFPTPDRSGFEFAQVAVTFAFLTFHQIGSRKTHQALASDIAICKYELRCVESAYHPIFRMRSSMASLY
jgi:hypothetical protein